MKVERRTLARFQNFWRMMLILGTVFIAGGVMSAMGKAPAQHASGPRKSVSARWPGQMLPARTQSAISAALGRDQEGFHAAAVRKGYRMKSPQSNLQATFTRHGVRVESGKARWGISLAAFGTSGKMQPVAVANPQAKQNRVEYRRGSLTEWYVNGPAGLEQGFTIAKAPAGGANGTLELALRLTGNVTASVDAAKTGLILKGKQTSLRYTGLAARDAKGRKLRSWLEVRNGRLLVQVVAAGATYPLVVDPYIQSAKLVASDGAKNDWLGWSVAISADGSTVVAGAPSATVGSNAYQGAAYVFTRSAAGWTQAAKLVASDGAEYDNLGQSVGMSADGTTVVAGAPFATISSNDYQGAVYVFTKSGSSWTQAAKLTASDGATDNNLGDSVGISPDGTTVAAGGSPSKVYVFVKQGSSWTDEHESAQLVASDQPFYYPYLGYSLSVSRDGATVVAGAPPASHSVGAVYVYDKPSGGWSGGAASPRTEDAKLVPSDGSENDDLGWSVAISADGSTVVAGAPIASNAVYVYDKPSGGWSGGAASPRKEDAKLVASDGSENEDLGESVAVSSDGSTVAAGALYALNDSDVETGAVYVFTKPSGGWADAERPQHETDKLVAEDGAKLDRLGLSTSITTDGMTVVTGAPGAKVGSNSQQGAVYVFTGSVPFMSFNASKLKITLGPPSHFALNSSFILGTDSDGINPLTDSVTLKIGGLSLTIPAGSFHLQHKRSNVYVFSGVVDGFTVNAKFESTDYYDWTFKANGSSPNGLSITNPVTVTLSIGNDSGAKTETVPIN